MGIILILLALVAVTSATTCFVHIGTNDAYDVMVRTTVETQRGCELLCLANDTCAGFSFNDTGLSSPCVLLRKGKVPDQQCTQRFYFYSKETYGCTARTNITEEFGTDPCIDASVPVAIKNLTGTVACTDDQRLDNVVFSDGRRISLDNTLTTFIVKSGDMWQYRDEGVTPVVTEQVVAASKTQQSYAAVPDRVNPCVDANTTLNFMAVHSNGSIKRVDKEDTAEALITCIAGKWFGCFVRSKDVIAIEGAGCLKY